MNSTTTWIRTRDDYGRSTHVLHRAGYSAGHRATGVVVKHPALKAGEYGSYWYCRWDLPYGTPREIAVVKFTNLKDAKAALEAATR